MRITEITLGGVTYPACFSLRVALETAERFGSVDAVLEKDLPAGEALRRKIWTVSKFLVAGHKAAAKEGKETPTPPTEDELLDGMDVGDNLELTKAILTVLAADSQGDVELQKEPKNLEARQDQ